MIDVNKLVDRLRGHLFGTEKIRTCDEAADALTAQAATIAEQASEVEALRTENERLRGIVPEAFVVDETKPPPSSSRARSIP